jgi:putative transposase
MVRLGDLLKEIAVRHGYQLLTARVHDGDHMHLFVSAPPRASIPEMIRVFKCITAKRLFSEFTMAMDENIESRS